MAASIQSAKEHTEPALAAIDLDQDDWYVAVGDSAGGGQTREIRDASQLAACVGSAAVVATLECRDELARVAPQIQARFVPRLVSVARAFREEIGGLPCLVFWIGRKQTACGLVIGENVVEENDPQLTLSGIFQYFAANLPGLQSWMKDRDERQRTAAFEQFVSNLRDGTTLQVGGGRWMRSPARIPAALVKDGLGRLRESVDPQRRAVKLVVSGWASAAHWDVAGTLGAAFPDLSLISRPNGSGFYESVTGLIDYGWEHPLPGQTRPAKRWIPGKDQIAQAAVLVPTPPPDPEPAALPAPPVPEPALPAPEPTPEIPEPASKPREPALKPPEPESKPPEPEPKPPEPASTPARNLTSEANDLQGKRVVRLAKSAAVLVGSLGPLAATHRQSLKRYLALAQQSKGLAGVLERREDPQPKDLESFRDAVASLEKISQPADFFGLLDEFPSDEPEAVEIRKEAGIEPIDPVIGNEILTPDKFEVIGRKGTGKRARVAAIHQRGYTVDGKPVRPPRVDLVFEEVKRPAKWMRAWWAAGALAALFVVTLLMKPSDFKRVATVAVGEPVLSVWSVPGTARLFAQSGNGQICNLHIWQATQWNNASVLPTPCGPTVVSADGSLAAWSSPDGLLPTVTKTNNGSQGTMGPQQYQHDGPITALGFTPDGRFLYSAATDGYVRQWNVETAKYVRDLADQDRKPLQSLLVAGNVVAAGEATTPGARIKVWLSGRDQPVVLAGDVKPEGVAPSGPPMAAVTAMAYDTAARLFFAGTADGEILTWMLEDHYDNAPDGQYASLAPAWRHRPAPDKAQTLAIAPGARLFAGYADSVFSWLYATSGERVLDRTLIITQDKPFSFGTAMAGAAVVVKGQTEFLAVGGGGDDHSIGIWHIAQ